MDDRPDGPSFSTAFLNFPFALRETTRTPELYSRPLPLANILHPN